jgi:hypothetical protein
VVCFPASVEELLADPRSCPAGADPGIADDISLLCDFASVTAMDATLLTTSPINILQRGTTLIDCAAVNANRGKQSMLMTSLKPGAAVPQGCRWNPAQYPFNIPRIDEVSTSHANWQFP